MSAGTNERFPCLSLGIRGRRIKGPHFFNKLILEKCFINHKGKFVFLHRLGTNYETKQNHRDGMS